jgi:hypothetical protein
MSRRRERLAWGLLLGSFVGCLLITVSLPIGINTFLENARRPLLLYVHSSQGTLVRDNGIPLSATDAPQEADVPLRLITNNLADIGLLQVFVPSVTPQFLARVRVYGNSVVEVQKASLPRFSASELEPQLDLLLRRGRLRLSVAPSETDAQLVVTVATPHGTVTIRDPGDYSLDVNETMTQLSVLNGVAHLESADSQLVLLADQRGVVEVDSGLQGPFSAERNLVRNGDFSAGFGSWITTAWSVERADQPSGETLILDANGESVLRFRRNGVGNAKTEVRQIIQQDVIDYNELRLSLSLRIWSQSLLVCGSLGSECPLTVRIDYEDEFGRSVAWQQGFYAVGEPSEENPPFCSGCGDPLRLNGHYNISKLAEVVVFESENWLARLSQEGFRPMRIKTISLIAEGHSFEVDVIDVALIAKE